MVELVEVVVVVGMPLNRSTIQNSPDSRTVDNIQMDFDFDMQNSHKSHHLVGHFVQIVCYHCMRRRIPIDGGQLQPLLNLFLTPELHGILQSHQMQPTNTTAAFSKYILFQISQTLQELAKNSKFFENFNFYFPYRFQSEITLLVQFHCIFHFDLLPKTVLIVERLN